MFPSDPWDQGSSGGRSSPDREGSRFSSGEAISIDRLALLLQPEQRPGAATRDVRLKELAEQACLATGATGAAIALARGDEFVCRASTGSTAPDLGIRLNIDHGLSAFCVRTGEVQRCDDSETDTRVDAEVCRHLGVRSVLVVPITYGDFFLGIFEIFAPQPFAFYDRDIQTVIALARSVLTALGISAPAEVEIEPEPEPEQEEALPEPVEIELSPPIPASRPRTLAQEIRAENEEIEARADPKPKPKPKPELEPEARAEPEEFYPQFKIVEKQPRDYWTGVLTILLVALALLLGWMIGYGRTARQQAAQDSQAVGAPASKPGVPEEIEISAAPVMAKPARSAIAGKLPAQKSSADDLVVYQEGKIVYRQGQAPRKVRNQPEATELSPEVAGSLLSLRTEPNYPDRARRLNVQGAVVLQAFINEDGSVQQLKVLTGNTDLAVAAIDAVRQWRFKPYAVKGKASAFTTRITVNFALPGAG
jgi:TonB family protein